MAPRPKRVGKTSKATPDFIKWAGLFDGEWMQFSKLALLGLTRPDIFTLKVNVWALIAAQTFGYETELAVVMRKLKEDETVAAVKLNRATVKVVEHGEGRTSVVEIITMQGLGSKLFAAWMQAFKESGIKPTDLQLAELKKSRQQLRMAVHQLEDNGLCERARLNCRATKLAGMGYEQAVTAGLLTPLSKLSTKEKKQVGAGDRRALIGLFLLAKPRPAKNLCADSGSQARLPDSSNPNDINTEIHKLLPKPEQTAFRFFREAGVPNPALAKKVAARDAFQQLHGELTAARVEGQHARQKEKAAMEKIRIYMAPIVKAAQLHLPFDETGESGSQARLPDSPPNAPSAAPPRPFLATPDDTRIPDADFRAQLVAAFVDASRPHPTPAQTREVMETLPDHALARRAFLDDLRDCMPRIKHPGVLPGHTRSFVAAWPAKLDKIEVQRAEELRAIQRQREIAQREEEQARQTARSILANPNDPIWNDEDRKWAREILGETKAAS